MAVYFNFVSNLIIIYLIIYLYFFGIKCNGFRVKIGEELWNKGYCNWLMIGATCKRPREKHMLEVQMTQLSKAFREWLTTWPTCNLTHEMHNHLFMFVSLISLPTLMKLYEEFQGKKKRKKKKKSIWELEIVTQQSSTHFS